MRVIILFSLPVSSSSSTHSPCVLVGADILVEYPPPLDKYPILMLPPGPGSARPAPPPDLPPDLPFLYELFPYDPLTDLSSQALNSVRSEGKDPQMMAIPHSTIDQTTILATLSAS